MKARGLFLVVVIAAFVLVTLNAQAQVPQLINYQGQLTNSNGAPANGTFTMLFRIYNAASGGNQVYAEAQSVTVNNGVFNVLLGSVTPIPLTLFDSGSNRFLEIVVNEVVLSPRRQFGSVPYAFTTRFTGGDSLCCTLDQSYDAGGSGAGRTINADAGAVNILGAGGLTVDGKVGIGTTSPVANLHVAGPGDRTLDISTTDPLGSILRLKAVTSNNLLESQLHFRGRLGLISPINGNSIMTLFENGNVGIGTTSPAAKLVELRR